MPRYYNTISAVVSTLIELIRRPARVFGRFFGGVVEIASPIKKKIFGDNSSGTSPSTPLDQRTVSFASPEASTMDSFDLGYPDNFPPDNDTGVVGSRGTRQSPLVNAPFGPGDEDQGAAAMEILLDPQTGTERYPENDSPGDHEAKPDKATPITLAPISLDRVDPTAWERRSRLGGKGQFLTVMTRAGLPVPSFEIIEHTMLQAIDDVKIEPQLLAQFHPGSIDASQLQPVTLGSLKDSIPTMDRINQTKWLDALGKLLISDDFLQEVARLPVADTIKRLYQQLVPDGSNKPVIIRSSGLKEDAFGDAQAGKYESCPHSGGDILKSCLEVLASGYQPTLCPDGTPQPMALIVQSYLDCRFGGVALSHTSLQDDTLQIEYAPGQPRGAVAGTNSLKPHRYQIKRSDNNPIQWSRGKVPSYFTLKETAEGFTEEKREGPSAEELPQGIPEQLKRHMVQLENLLGCPVDVEFAVDQKDRLYLVQVRPITALTGAASFSGNPPAQPLCAGEVVSEGMTTGEAYYVDKAVTNPSIIPEGAIIHAVNADLWMLEAAIINRASGYVFKNGGNNDHIAIMLKQSGKPCMRSDAPFTGEKPKSPSRVTLIAGNFHQKSGAYLLDGDQTAHWSTRYTKPTLDYAAALTTSAANKPCTPTFTRVEQGFLWLHAQNQRVLNYFLRRRLLNLCLAPGNNKSLSMLPCRAQVLQVLKVELENFLLDIQYLVEGYERFLELHRADEVTKEYYLEEVKDFLREIPLLKELLTGIKSEVFDRAKKIIDPMITPQELPEQPVDYDQWLHEGKALMFELQGLLAPEAVVNIRSAHDLVFYIHKQFISALEPVASLSGQGVVEKKGITTISNFVLDKSKSLLTKPIIKALNSAGRSIVLNLPTACIANIQLGQHACTLAMFEHSEGGKGRKLQLTFSDSFSITHQGKLKRFWYLAHAIRLKLTDKEVQNMTTQFNHSTNAMTIELRHMESTAAMNEGFLSLVKLLSMLENIDLTIREINLSGRPEMWQWDHTTVEKMVRESQNVPEKNDFKFKLCLSLQGLSHDCRDKALRVISEYSLEHQIFLSAPGSFYYNFEFIKWGSEQDLVDEYDQWFTKITAPLQSDAERVKKELAFIMLTTFRDFHRTLYIFVKQKYPEEFKNKDFLKKLCCCSFGLFSILPSDLVNDKSFATDPIMSHESAFHFAGEDIKSDKSIVIDLLERYPNHLRLVSTALKEDREVVLAAVKKLGISLYHAGESPRNDYEVVMTAIRHDAEAITYASDNLKEDEKFILAAARENPRVLEVLKKERENSTPG